MYQKVDLIDVTGPLPVVTQGPDTDQVRFWSNMTVMADGRVFLNGGSTVGKQERQQRPHGADLESGQPRTLVGCGHGPEDTALSFDRPVAAGRDGADRGRRCPGSGPQPERRNLLPRRIFTIRRRLAGGAADDRHGPADRPTRSAVPDHSRRRRPISRVTFLRVGAATHSLNTEQRFFDLARSGSGPQLTVTPPSNINFAHSRLLHAVRLQWGGHAFNRQDRAALIGSMATWQGGRRRRPYG